MKYLDFKYDGSYLSDYGFIICDFDYSGKPMDVNIGSEINFNLISHRSGERFTLSNSQIEDCIELTFDICKNPDLFDRDKMEITSSECKELMRWLNRRGFSHFQFVDDSIDTDIIFNSSFNIKKITISEKLCGLRLEMKTDSPYAYGGEISETFVCSGQSDVKTMSCRSDDIGFLYPVIEIKCRQAGNMEIHNMTDETIMQIKNVTVGETITIDSFYQTIITSNVSHKIFNDFNFVFFKLANLYRNNNTNFYASLRCDITIRYSPIIKDVF